MKNKKRYCIFAFISFTFFLVFLVFPISSAQAAVCTCSCETSDIAPTAEQCNKGPQTVNDGDACSNYCISDSKCQKKSCDPKQVKCCVTPPTNQGGSWTCVANTTNCPNTVQATDQECEKIQGCPQFGQPVSAVTGCCIYPEKDDANKSLCANNQTAAQCASGDWKEKKNCSEFSQCSKTSEGPAPATGSGAGGAALRFPNPLGTLEGSLILGRILQLLTGFMGGIALLVFIWGGFLWLTSGGNVEKIKKAQSIIVWAALGLAVIAASYIIVRFIIVAIATGAGVR